ncbi:MAG TPA: TetR/AcrR family transcriptional regulator [Chitinophagales bacterium]|mgnify:CR=1 FL=1|jgi:AcrR family transcriptional regulator|nr:TetR/AcrR family transcriptional regulator [Chitinophagales bacterium]MBP6154830.1 TetR/AcrR family transcriptional regulator [Chitinophagales bacterium]HQV78557.1 TetR/AcrR family transcriptional regulator [Chitinophagales bacterium]HQW79057.1 TetR/AcrR family transcriptional regulator [Chitinophagales bacterium]HRB67562.1 TetR/AcrR family transcriptional regulator [Chitinophagales bacterium]
MTISNRRFLEKELLRQTILDVAKDIAASDGWQNVTIRKICDRIGYTAPVIYQYFDSKEKLLQSLREEGFRLVFEQFELVDKKHTIPEIRLMKYANVWWVFSKNNPEIYQVMFNLQGALCENNENNQSKMVVNYYNLAFAQISKRAKRSEKFRLELCDNIISIIHGFISMRMVNKNKSKNEHIDVVFKNSLHRFLHSIKDESII